ncbi:MAG: sigma-70 family RNA polymerase sigma factor [Calothrix sp. MO_192.B10]|nr:sigma-70 family RNA polymerase sigma factor [Calothrix sp. MO_192.B10]
MKESDECVNPLSLDERLQQLALEAKELAEAAKENPAKIRAKQQALTRLVSALQSSGKLVRPQPGQFQGFYKEVHAEGLQRLFVHICKKIVNYDPEKGEVLQWANFLLKRQFYPEAAKEFFPTLPKGVDPRGVKRLTLDDLDRENPTSVIPQQIPLLSQQIIQCLEEDPEGIFRNTYIKSCPIASFQIIAIQRLSGYSWEDISQTFDPAIPIPTLSSFYQRCVTKFAPKLKEYLS